MIELGGLIFLQYFLNMVKLEMYRAMFKTLESEKLMNLILNNLEESIITMMPDSGIAYKN